MGALQQSFRVLALSLALSATTACAHAPNLPQDVAQRAEMTPAEQEVIQDRLHAHALALLQATPLEAWTCREAEEESCIERDAARVMLKPSFRAIWLITISEWRDNSGREAFVTASRFDPFLDNKKQVGAVSTQENVISVYSASLNVEEFSTLRRALTKNGALAKPTKGAPIFWDGTRERIQCLDGLSWSFEAQFGDANNYFSRGECTAEFASDYAVVRPLVDMALKKLPMIAGDVSPMVEYISSYVANTDPGD